MLHTQTHEVRSRRRWFALAGIAVVVASVSAFASSAGTAAPQRNAGGSLTIADVAPFTGVDAALGPTYLVACDAASNAINKAGGVLGNQINCKVCRHARRPGRRWFPQSASSTRRRRISRS